MVFGRIAQAGLSGTMPLLTSTHPKFKIIRGPHPAARHKTVMSELHKMATAVREASPAVSAAAGRVP
jgi:hypothetical protein